MFEACKKEPQHRYLFLTKNPKRYKSLIKDGKLPEKDNFWYGSSMPTPTTLFASSDRHNMFVSIEPMMEKFPCLEGHPAEKVRWIILGAMTGPGSQKHQPKREWIEAVVEIAQAQGTAIFMKDSLLPIVGEENMLREYPWKEANHDRVD